MSKKIIVMAGGGTGGHVFPIKSLIETIISEKQYSDKTEKIVRIGSKNSLEQETAKNFGDKVQFIQIFSGKFRRETPLKSHLKNFRDLFLFVIGCFQSIYRLIKIKADVVFCKGGYVALPVVCAAKILNKPIYVHESDVRPGLVNKIANRFSKKSFCGFDHVFQGATVVGQIISNDVVPNNSEKSDFSQKLKNQSDTKKTSILVMGGSQGSKGLYQNLAQILQQNEKIRKSFIFHIVLGKLNEDLKDLFTQFDSVITYDFLSQSEMGQLYTICDVALTRAGTTSLAEQKLFNIKSIIVPIPRTHDQKLNADRYVKNFNDILVEQSKETTLSDLQQTLINLIDYKKPKITANIADEIGKAKKIILQEIFK